MAKLGLGDWGELVCTGAGIIGGLGAVAAGLMTGTGYIMKKCDSTYEQRKLTKQRQQITNEVEYLIQQEVKRQRYLEQHNPNGY